METLHRGRKHLCTNCGSLFYDLQGDKDIDERLIICPACTKTHDPYKALRLASPQTRVEEETEKEDNEFDAEVGDIIPEDTSDLQSNELIDIAPEKENASI